MLNNSDLCIIVHAYILHVLEKVGMYEQMIYVRFIVTYWAVLLFQASNPWCQLKLKQTHLLLW